MTAVGVQTVADCVIAASAAIGLAAWLWRAPRRVGVWYRRKRRDSVLNVALPLSLATLIAAVLIARSDLEKQREGKP